MLFFPISLEGFFFLFLYNGQLILCIGGALQANVSFKASDHFKNGKDVLLRKLCGNEMENDNLRSLCQWTCKPWCWYTFKFDVLYIYCFNFFKSRLCRDLWMEHDSLVVKVWNVRTCIIGKQKAKIYKTASLFCAFVSFLSLILMGIQRQVHMKFVHRV